ncbi:ABC transporter substrate-binding protein [Longimicrobium sp.]|uniref:ABC transporter substrate-binding protein n=1 Tax=Longimicrobium sp. TaxID=2029185 RepID=UPI002B592760|nr:ABC transporter substrate-binding protein [Longimicrobium sp.]HSU13700.1 ABC transporter substrate-binding protein [Longimicrobium sp.]
MRRYWRFAALLMFAAAPFLRSAAAAAQQPVGDTLRIGLVLPDSASRTKEMASAARGVRMGVEEAAHSAALFGRTVTLAEGADADRLVADGRVQALLGGFGDAECRALQGVARARGVVWIDLGCDADALRGRECAAAGFHVAPSAAMMADAAAQAAVADGRVEAWDARLERFGADQLNQRFRARFGEGMDSQGWVGWFAVKMLWESTLRARSSAPDALMRYLSSDAAQFDGHKGRPLSFRAWDHQLRQPLYVVSPAAPDPVEVPRAAPGSDTPSRDVLDRLGTPRGRTECGIGG